jgi:lysyl-tRNA synthetase class 2
LNDQEQARQAKLAKYVELGVDPFGSRYAWKDRIRDIREKYGKLTAEELTAQNIASMWLAVWSPFAGWAKPPSLTSKMNMARSKAWIGINVIGEHDYEVFKLADLGDIVGLEGTLMLTRTGELTIRVSKYTHITKCLKPLPEKFHGLTDTEDRYRKRYLDLIVNDDSRQDCPYASADHPWHSEVLR